MTRKGVTHRLEVDYERRPVHRIKARCTCGQWSKDLVRASRARERVLKIAFVQHVRTSP